MSAEMSMELPGINRRVFFQASWRSGMQALGCHAGTITSIGLSLIQSGKQVLEVLEPEPGAVLTIPSSYGGYPVMHPVEYKKVEAYLNAHKVDYRYVPGFFEKIVQETRSIPIWVISDVINTDAPARSQGSALNPGHKHSYTAGRTADFVQWLIRTGTGYVQGSPIIQNPQHRMQTNYSLNQVWTWVHPAHLARTAPGTAFASGEERLPSWDEWYGTVGKDLGLKTREEVEKGVWGNYDPEIIPPKRRVAKRAITAKEVQ